MLTYLGNKEDYLGNKEETDACVMFTEKQAINALIFSL